MDLSDSPRRPACPSRASGWSSLTTPWGSPVLRSLSLCTCCRHYPGTAAGRITSLIHPAVSAFPIWQSSRPAHRPFRGLLGVHSRYGLHTRAVTVYRDTLTRGFSHFVTSIAAPVASGWSGCRVGLAPTGKRRLSTAHASCGQGVGCPWFGEGRVEDGRGALSPMAIEDRSHARLISRGRHVTNAGERRGRRGKCAYELAPIHHGPPFPNID